MMRSSCFFLAKGIKGGGRGTAADRFSYSQVISAVHHVFQHIRFSGFYPIFPDFIFIPPACTLVCLLPSRATPSDIGLEKAAALDSEAPDQSAESLSTTQRINQIYCKSLRLTSEQIVRVLQKD